MFVAVFVTLTAAYLAFGTERAFEPGSYRTSLVWCLTSLVLGVPSAAAGGWVCAKLAKTPGAVTALMVVVVVLGVALAVPTLLVKPTEDSRSANVPNLEAMAKAQTPAWVAFLNPLVGAVGVLLGSRLARKTAELSSLRRTEPAHPG